MTPLLHTTVCLFYIMRCVSVLAKPLDEDEDEDNTQRLNLYGLPLKKCDRPEALRSTGISDPQYEHTGYARDDHCGSMTEDEGTHYICVDLPKATASNGEVYSPFWTKTGQAESADVATNFPKPGPWCICMWAFSNMYQQHQEFGKMVDCSATNYWTVQMYELSNKKDCEVLLELCSRCNLEAETTRQNVQLKCNMAKKFCSSLPSSETCAANGNCAEAQTESSTWISMLKASPKKLLLGVLEHWMR